MPQPLTWNSGTTWRTTSSSVKREPDLGGQACRYSSRWVIATPFGRPVVPLV